MTNRIQIDIDHIKEHVNYNRDTGVLTWRKNFFKTKVDSEVGSVSNLGYRKFGLSGTTYLSHRVVWAIHYSEQPPEIIDHINGNRLDNRIANLRSSDHTENAENQRKAMRSNKTSKYLGVSKFKGRWRARIKARGKYIFLGYHETEEQARDAYLDAKRRLHAGCEI
ncbi:AP2/ERF domain protein [Vibrio phage 1.242.O._10N.261.54.B2]|nr:AP2/ERF domain protein [Vibrio phage 1.242.O._10N.261.54.B2]